MKKNDKVSSEKTYFSCLDIYESSSTYDLDQGGEETAYSKYARKPGSLLLARYKIIKVLKENTFGFIYLVERVNKNTKYIIKEFFPHEYVTRNDKEEMILNTPLDIDSLIRFNYMQNFFMGEANNLEKISIRPHPNIIKIASVEKNKNNTTYIIYPHKEGMTLHRYMEIKARMGKQLDNRGLDKILKPLIDALEHLHSLGIVHLNIKPENILIQEDGSLLLLGFEASTFFNDEDSRVFCNAYTLPYAAPEQININNSAHIIDGASDIYAVGTLLYKMVTGIYPPDVKERMACKAKHIEYDPYMFLQEKKELLEKYNFPLLVAIDKSLMLSRKERFKDMLSFKNALFGAPSIPVKSFVENKRNFLLYISVLLASIYIIFEGLSQIGNNDKVVVTPVPEKIVKSEQNTSLLKIEDESIEDVSRNNTDSRKEYVEFAETVKIKEISIDENKSKEIENIVKDMILLNTDNVEKSPVEEINAVSTNVINEIPSDENRTTLNDMLKDKNTESQEATLNIILQKKKTVKKTAKKILKKRKKRVIRKKRIKKKTRIQSRKPTVKSRSGLVWYCKAIGGNIRTSARNADKVRSKNMALNQCRRRAGSKKQCRILNCFLLR